MENNRGKTLMTNANENRDKLVENLNKKIEQLENMIENINSNENDVVSACINSARQYDINYVPNKDIIEDFEQLKDSLYTVKEKLQNLSLKEETIFDEDVYLIKAEELLGKIDNIINKKIQEFAELNKKKLDEASDRKIKIEIGLSNSRIELNHLNLEKEKLEEQMSDIKKGIIYRIKSKLFNKEGNAKTEEINSRLVELESKKRDLESKISKLKMQEETEHFVPSTTPQSNDDQITNEKEKEDLDQEK